MISTHNRSLLKKFLLQSDFLSIHLSTIFTTPLVYCSSRLLRFSSSRPLSSRLLSISSKSDCFRSYDDF
nr:MAG TPA: hypothetical protein [Caudoviricetes sp.]